MMKRVFRGGLIVSCALAVAVGCGRKDSPETAKAPDAAAPVPKAAPSSGSSNQSDANAMALIKGGKFMMGDKDEVDAPPHEVSVSSFFMDKHLVTQEQYQKVMGKNPSRWKGEQNPVEQLR